MKKSASLLLVCLAACSGTTPDKTEDVSERKETPAGHETRFRKLDPAKQARAGDLYLDGTVLLKDLRLGDTSRGAEFILENQTKQPLKIEYRFRYFKDGGKEVIIRDSYTHVPFQFPTSGSVKLTSEAFKYGITSIGLDIRKTP